MHGEDYRAERFPDKCRKCGFSHSADKSCAEAAEGGA